MSLSALVMAAVALAAQAPVAVLTPITVTGHPWAPFISPMGEPFRSHSPNDDPLADWFHGADRNHDGFLSVDEMVADAERFFATLDTNHDGQIDPDELDHYEWEIAPEIQVNSRTRRQRGQAAPVAGEDDVDELQQPSHKHKHSDDEEDSSLGIGGALQGAARYGLLNIPEPVAGADMDFNRAISLDEFRRAAVVRFQLLDSTRQGRLTLVQLEAMRPKIDGRRHRRNDHEPDRRVGNSLPAHL